MSTGTSSLTPSPEAHLGERAGPGRPWPPFAIPRVSAITGATTANDGARDSRDRLISESAAIAARFLCGLDHHHQHGFPSIRPRRVDCRGTECQGRRSHHGQRACADALRRASRCRDRLCDCGPIAPSSQWTVCSRAYEVAPLRSGSGRTGRESDWRQPSTSGPVSNSGEIMKTIKVEKYECEICHATYDPARPLSEPAPCDSCLRAPRCASERLACTAFARFNNGARWQAAPRTDANHERYMQIFAER